MRRGVSYGANIRNKSVLYAMLYVLLAPWPPIVACPLMRKAGPGNHPSPPPRPAALAGGGARGGRPCCTKKESPQIVANSLGCCDSDGIQTRNLLIRSQMLYSVELRSQRFVCASFLNCGAKVRSFFERPNIFAKKLPRHSKKVRFSLFFALCARFCMASCLFFHDFVLSFPWLLASLFMAMYFIVHGYVPPFAYFFAAVCPPLRPWS